ncbi:MAG: hypothetical protein KC416_17185, partial [Myxococcales bacterium]|nr:hypothetical protein [Myxococcales bacterium]
MWAHSKLDAILVVLAVGEVALLAAGTVLAPGLPPATTVALGALLVALNCTNFQCIAHNHLHNPFFKNPAANRLFGLINSCALGGPQGLYRVHP